MKIDIYNQIKFLSFALYGLFSIFLFSLTLYSYEGSKYIYVLYSISINALIITSFVNNKSFFEIFFTFFLWLGFWFKLSFIISFWDYKKYGFFEYVTTYFVNIKDMNETINEVMFVLSFIFIFLNILFVFRKKFLKLNINYKTQYVSSPTNFVLLYVLTVFLLLVSIYMNNETGTFKKGVIDKSDINFFLGFFIKWFLMIGFYTLFSYLIVQTFGKLDGLRFKLNLITYIFLIGLICWSTNSRAMPIYLLMLFYGILYYCDNNKIKLNFFNVLSLFVLSIIVISFVHYDVSKYRGKNFYLDKISNRDVSTDYNQETLKENFSSKFNQSRLLQIVVKRWVGIDSFIAVHNHKDKSINILKLSIKEKVNFEKANFYLDYFVIKNSNYNYKDSNGFAYPIILPGILSFLYYSGSILFLLALLFSLYFFAILIEILSLRLSGNNFVFSSLISSLIAYRYIHFGYLPANSYKILLGIILSIFIIYILNILREKKYL